MKKLLTILAAGLVALACTAKPVMADDDDDAPKPKKATPKAAAGALTDESLGDLLEKLGYEAKGQKTKTGMYYSIEFEEDGWTFRYSVSLSPNKKFVWISTSVLTLSEGANIPADALMKLLEENDRIGPTTISYDKQIKQIRVAVALFNRGITASALKEQMGYFTANVKAVGKLVADLKAPAKPKKAPKKAPPVDDDDDK
jgi:hypothetical protein